MDNPYQTPAADLTLPGKIKLYTAGHVAWAAFLGSPFAGCVLMAINYRRLGNRNAARWAIVSGVIVTIAAFGTAFVVPENFSNFVLPAVYTYGTYLFAKSFQGQHLRHAFSEGGRKASAWSATGIAVICCIFVLVTLIASFAVMPEEWFSEEI